MKPERTVYYWLRTVNDLSQKEVAEKLQISISYVRAIESGRKMPSSRLKRAYAKLLDVDENIITEFSEKPITPVKKLLLSLLEKIAI